MQLETLTILNAARGGGPRRWQGGHHIDRLPGRPVWQRPGGWSCGADVVHSRGEAFGVLTRLVRWLQRQGETAGQRLFADDDLHARQHGWEITVRRGGFGRQYRDPRFRTLQPCPRCAGNGTAEGEPCGLCAATGRVTVHISSAAGR
jgi:hypothetical protein